MADRDDSNYEVGYGKPPKHSQFPKNKSGNPGGRPKGARGLKAELEAELNEFVTLTVNGKRKRVRKRRLVITALTTKAIKGNVSAADKLLALMIQAFGFEEQKAGSKPLSDTDQLILDQFFGSDVSGTNRPVEVTLIDPNTDEGSPA